ncbi:hypothetical protein SARC_06859 [Sphaeroforma arctica JP610]|uniref:Peptidase M13 C-terminal domain-containing protein n=1 Tax=Sphaeroforma arctica JP610 TaxID=667725 RepID=A0A0L0FW54_9EUKA|nr:hypothetical protein SARC_06859 [Sphaeroforma arctica JP610]KNC80796.1 hypothetical protein SARC_06859 [Sphaeroforma arctica JP610]|eukprot:XP_014154698.1 hypothetical protein SARC_06859 [Sphaeroforma arctica JP610]
MNYGGIGAVIGHEVSHGFDDEGSQYDGTGNLENWWQNETETSFNELTQCFVNQYSEYTVLGKDGKELFVNGNLTLGENMADNGGLSSVVQAYDHYVDRNGEEPAMPGTDLTHKQLLFVNFARVWCGKGRPEANEQQVLRDPHSPPQHRVLGTLANMKEFAEAFNCPVGSRMNPDRQRCKSVQARARSHTEAPLIATCSEHHGPPYICAFTGSRSSQTRVVETLKEWVTGCDCDPWTSEDVEPSQRDLREKGRQTAVVEQAHCHLYITLQHRWRVEGYICEHHEPQVVKVISSTYANGLHA